MEHMSLPPRQNKLPFLALLFTLSSTLLSYVLLFQIPDAVSKKYLLYSLLIGCICGLLFYLFILRKNPLSEIKNKKSFYLYILLVTTLSFLVLTCPENLILAPRTCIEVAVPSTIENGQPIKIRNIDSGLQVIGYKSYKLSATSKINENGIVIFPGGNLAWCGRAWGKIRIDFTNVIDGSKYIIKTNNQSEMYQFDLADSETTVTELVEVPGYPILNILSRLSILISIFVFIYCLARGFNSIMPQNDRVIDRVYCLLCLLFLLYCVLSIYMPISPEKSIPNHDSGIFLYIGKSMLHGNVVYRDLWDHKGPVIYFLNALGLSFGMGTWGVWIIEATFTYLALLIIFYFFGKKNLLVGILTALLFSGLLERVIEGGNLVEEYAIFFYVFALYLFQKIENGQSNKDKLILFLIGIVFGCAFLLRATLVSVFLSIYAFVFIENMITRQIKKGWDILLAITLGFITTFGVFSIYFMINSAFSDFISAAFQFNFSYQSVQSTNLIAQIIWGFNYLQIPLAFILVIIAITIIGEFLSYRKNGNISNMNVIIIIGFFIELVLYNISGRGYPHYLQVLIPYLVLITGSSVFHLINFIEGKYDVHIPEVRLEHAISISLLILITPYLFLHLQKTYHSLPPPEKSFINELENEIPDNKSMLIWGSHTLYNYLLDIPANSKFINIVGLTECGYVTDEMVKFFTSQIKENKPWMIYPETAYAPLDPLDSSERRALPICPKLSPFFNYFDGNYRKVNILSNGWNVYQPVDY